MEWYPEANEVIVSDDELPGCCSTVVFHEAQYQELKDLGMAFPTFVEQVEANLILYTLNDEQTDVRDVLLKNGFTPLTFLSLQPER